MTRAQLCFADVGAAQYLKSIYFFIKPFIEIKMQ